MNGNYVLPHELPISEQLDLALRLLERLHRGGDWWLYSRPQGKGYE